MANGKARKIGNIEQRAQSWRVQWERKGNRYAESFLSEDRAVWFQNLLTANGGEYPDGWVPGVGFPDKKVAQAGGRTFGDVVDEYLRRELAEGASYRVAEVRWRNLGAKTPLAKTPLGDVTETQAREFVRDLQGKYSVNYIYLLVKNLRASHAYAVRQGWISGESPFARIKRDAIKGKRKRPSVFLRDSEVQTILAKLPARYRLFFRVLFESGIRVGEGYALRPYSVRRSRSGRYVLDIDRTVLADGSLGETTKGGMSRQVPLSGEIGREVAALAMARNDERRLFDLPTYNTVRRAWMKAVRESGLLDEYARGINIHDCRHTAASRMLGAGVPMATVGKWLGHRKISITVDLYGHLHSDDERLLEIVDALALAS